MIRVKLFICDSVMDCWFENLVNYDKSKTSSSGNYFPVGFENLVNYDKSKTKIYK